MSDRKRFVQLDALRGIAALIVVVSHSANAQLLPRWMGHGFGEMGVGVFYLLSAFLITTIYLERDFSTAAIVDYSIRRAARVLPLFYAALVVSFCVQIAAGISVYHAFESWESAWGNALLIQGTSVLWSIPVEVQFYLIFLVFWWLRRRSLALAFVFLGLAQIGLLRVAAITAQSDHSLPYWMHFFTIGCAFGIVAQKCRPRISRSRMVGAAGLAALTLTPVVMPEVRRSIGLVPREVYADPMTVTWVSLVGAVFVFGIVRRSWVDFPVLRWMGELSFSVYLSHMAVLIMVAGLFDQDLLLPFDRFALVLLVTFGLSAIVTKGFERPVQKAILSAVIGRRSLRSTPVS